MKTVCEIVAQDILPILRAAIAKELINSYNLNQSEAAKLLDVSQPAVSQYLRQLRGKNNLIENKAVLTEIKDISNKLYLKQIDQSQLATNMCMISKIILEDGKNGSFHKIADCAACK
ncbi:MAG: hypothetical protein WC613_04150 [Candidatus Aenigmatarchaeota archaeon]